MRLCRDICNRSKHLIYTKKHNPSIDAYLSIAREYKGQNLPVALVVLADDTHSDLLEVVDGCVAFWDRVLRERALI
jgi:hypothetical protein